MISALKKGDKVVTIGGIHGVVSSTKEKTIIVKVDSNTSIEFNRSAIAAVVRDEVKPAKSAKKETKSEAKAEEAAPEVKTEAAESTESASENK